LKLKNEVEMELEDAHREFNQEKSRRAAILKQKKLIANLQKTKAGLARRYEVSSFAKPRPRIDLICETAQS
jgi:hypothetical protein